MTGEYGIYRYIDDESEKPVLSPPDPQVYSVSICRYRNDKILRKTIANFALSTFGKHKIYCVDDAKGLVSYIFVIPKCYKFPFMKKGDYQVGPAWTREDCRGQRIIGTLTNQIVDDLRKQSKDAGIYLLIRENNLPSQKAITRTKFQKVGICGRSKLLKRYVKVTD